MTMLHSLLLIEQTLLGQIQTMAEEVMTHTSAHFSVIDHPHCFDNVS